MLIVDETGFLKKGEKSVGVGRRYTGTAGKKEKSMTNIMSWPFTRPPGSGTPDDITR